MRPDTVLWNTENRNHDAMNHYESDAVSRKEAGRMNGPSALPLAKKGSQNLLPKGGLSLTTRVVNHHPPVPLNP